MITFTAEQIQARFEQLPKEIQDAVTSADVHNSIIEIAKKNNLHIDQEGDLVDQVGLVLLGLSPSKDFVKNFSSNSGVETATATAIASDINTEIFAKIKTSMRQIEEQATQTANQRSISDLERLGDFNIEATQVDQGTEHIESRDRLINSIENPPAVEVNTPTGTQHNMTEPFIDHLLSAPVVSVQQTTTVNVPKPPTDIPKPPQVPKGPDLYREPV